jgi:hypothetical protein
VHDLDYALYAYDQRAAKQHDLIIETDDGDYYSTEHPHIVWTEHGVYAHIEDCTPVGDDWYTNDYLEDNPEILTDSDTEEQPIPESQNQPAFALAA